MYCGGAAYTKPAGLYKCRSVGELRAYARGEQPSSKYRKMIDVCVKEGKVGSTEIEAGASLMNISMDNVRYFPKYRDLGIAKISEEEYEPIVRAMDSEASFQRKKEFYLGKIATDPRIGQLVQQAGVMPPSMQKFQNMSGADIETTSQMGGIQLAAESLMADIIGTTMDISEWAALKAMLVSDIWDANYAGAKVCCYGGSLRLEYTDNAGLIFPASKYPDHRDDQYVAAIRKTNIATLRAEYRLSEKQLYDIAKRYGGMNNNNAAFYGKSFSERTWRDEFAASNGYQVYDHFTVEVMDFYFICSQAEELLLSIYQSPTAESRVDTIGGTAYSEDKVAIQYVHRGCWVLGSDLVFGEGMDTAQMREGDDGRKRACLPIRVWSGDGASITERCISVIDDIQMAVLKVRLLIANLPPGPRFMMDMSVLENAVQFGKDSYDMRDMLTIFGATGKLLIRSKSEFDSGGASQKSPIIPIESGIQEDLAILANVIATGLDMIRQSTGMNEISDGTGNPNDVLNGVAKGFQAASNNALRPLSLAMASLHAQLYNTIAKKYQAMRLHSPVEVKRWALDASHFAVLSLPSDIPIYDFHVKARLLPSQEELQMVLSNLLQKQAEGIVTGADALIVMQMLRDRDIVKAQVYLGRAIAAAKEQEHQRQIQLINEQAQANAQSAQASEMARMKTVLAEKEADGRLLGVKDDYDAKKGKRDHDWKIEEIAAEGVAMQKVEIVKNATVAENVAQAA